MMSLAVIEHVNNQIARKAAKAGRVPYVPFGPEEVAKYPPFPFPNLGYHVPEGWEEVERWFVDKSGNGEDWEPALTWRQFKAALCEYVQENPGHGFALVEEGEFQAYIGAFAPVKQGLQAREAAHE